VQKGKDIILVTGATGHQGNETARLLLNENFRVRAMTHQPYSPKAALLAASGAEIVYGNLDDPTALYSALSGVKAIFSVQDSREAESTVEEERGKRLAYLAKEQDVKQFVYSSVASARAKSGIPHFEVKGRIEQTIRDLQFQSHTFLRGTFFMESLLDPTMFPEIFSAGKLICPISPETRVQMVSAEDVAKFALFSFQNPERMNAVELDIAGDEHTFTEIAAVLSAALQKPIEFSSVTIEDFAKLRRFSSELKDNVERIISWWDAAGWDVDIGGLMLASRNHGIEMKTFNEWASDVATAYGEYSELPMTVSS
jgi:uncharacterized protein YbjT (DUF2867 family)